MPQYKTFTFALMAAASLSACTSLPQSVGEASMFYRDYVGPPENQSAALVRLSADGVIRITPNSTCADFSNPRTGVALFSTFSLKNYGHLHNRKLGVRGSSPEGLTSTEITLEPDRPVVITYSRNWTERGTAYNCHVHRSFVPKATSHYQLLADPVYSERACRVLIAELTDPPSIVSSTPAKLCGA